MKNNELEELRKEVKEIIKFQMEIAKTLTIIQKQILDIDNVVFKTLKLLGNRLMEIDNKLNHLDDMATRCGLNDPEWPYK